jgi:hypothetical protein
VSVSALLAESSVLDETWAQGTSPSKRGGNVTDLAWLGAHSLNIRYRIFRISSLSNVSSIQRLSAQAP